MRPSWTATTDAPASPDSVANSGGEALAAAACALEAALAGVAAEDGVPSAVLLTSAAALWGETALAPAVAVEADSAAASGRTQETFVPLTGRRPSIRPVSVAITTFG